MARQTSAGLLSGCDSKGPTESKDSTVSTDAASVSPRESTVVDLLCTGEIGEGGEYGMYSHNFEAQIDEQSSSIVVSGFYPSFMNPLKGQLIWHLTEATPTNYSAATFLTCENKLCLTAQSPDAVPAEIARFEFTLQLNRADGSYLVQYGFVSKEMIKKYPYGEGKCVPSAQRAF